MIGFHAVKRFFESLAGGLDEADWIVGLEGGGHGSEGRLKSREAGTNKTRPDPLGLAPLGLAPPCGEYPFLLNTGRGSSAQWHTGSRTDKSDVLRKLAPRSLIVELHPADAARLGIADASDVLVRSRRGEARATAVLTTTIQPGQVFMPMHFKAVNHLTFPSFDPHSRQPSYKACAVALTSAKV